MKKLGERALLVSRPRELAVDLDHVAQTIEGVVDYVLSEDQIAFYFDRTPHVDERTILDALDRAPRLQKTRATHLLEVRYDGEDLASFAQLVKLDVGELVARHRDAVYTVAFLGFMPGFAYLSGLDPALLVARRATPRERVPAGALAVGGPYTGVYPFASPGGWHLIGALVSPSLFDAGRFPLLRTGDQVRFLVRP